MQALQPVRGTISGAFAVVLCLCFSPAPGLAEGHAKVLWTERGSAAKVSVDKDAAVHLPPMLVPFSSFASPEAKGPFLENGKSQEKYANAKTIVEQRQVFSDHVQPAPELTRPLYPADSLATTSAGVYTDVITPKDGIVARNKNRALINLHSGAFLLGRAFSVRWNPCRQPGWAKIKVVAIDYRQGPGRKFPAASKDLAAVYRELLKTYKPIKEHM